MRRVLLILVTLAGVACAVAAPPAGAARSADQQLVDRYAPVLMLRKQDKPPCDTSGEQYPPTSVDSVLGNPRVSLQLKRPGTPTRTIKQGPTAADIAGLGGDFYLDLPGDTLEPGCTYAKDFAALRKAGKAPAVTYTHIARQPGHAGFAVQYWFFYYFNQFNDVHEGDWEGMQLTFTADTPEQALVDGPDQIGLFQHGSGEIADWTDTKVQKEGDHPVVYPAAGSHATFFESAIYVGNGSGASGLGCDNTSEPLLRQTVTPVLVPTDPPRGSPYQWLTFLGRWGQREAGFNNGPNGPITKAQWLAPFDWMENKRSASPKLPVGSLLGPAISSVFCGAVASVSKLVNLQAQSPTSLIILLLVPLLILIALVAATTWRPVDPEHLRRRRHFGQLIRGARQVYGRNWKAMVPLGLTAVPIMLALSGLSSLTSGLLNSGDGANDTTVSGGSTIQINFGSLFEEIGRPIGLAVAAAFVISFLRLLDAGHPNLRGAYGATLKRFWRVVGAQLLSNLMLALLFLTIVGIPFAVWKYIGWQLVQQKILFEDVTVREAFRGSSRLVRGHWWHTVRITIFLELLSAAAGPILLMALVFTNLQLLAINALGTIVFALLIPYVTTARTLLYFDLVLVAQEPVPAKRPWWRRLGRRRTAASAPTTAPPNPA